MTAHRMILLWSSLQGVGRCIPLCLGLGFTPFCSFWKMWVPPTYGLKHAAARHICLGHRWCLAARTETVGERMGGGVGLTLPLQEKYQNTCLFGC